MSRYPAVLLIFLTVTAAASHAALPDQTARRKMEPVVRQIDRILIRTNDVQSLYDFFTLTLQLPISWPYSNLQRSASSGVGLGNGILEIFSAIASKDAGKTKAQAGFVGLAFEPGPLTACLKELHARGLSYDPPESYVSTLPDGSQGNSWTTVGLPQFSGPDFIAFLCEYSPSFLNVYVRRKQLAGQLVLSGGGPLGIQSIREIVLGTTNLDKDRILWRKLLLPAAPAPGGVWKIGSGPALRLVPGDADRILRIVLRVNSLDHAGKFLAGKGLLATGTGGNIAIDPSKIQGLKIVLADK